MITVEGAQDNSCSEDSSSPESDKSKVPLQLAIVGRPNVGKSTLLNALLQEDRVLVGPEAGLTRDSIRTQFEFQGRTIYLVNRNVAFKRKKQFFVALKFKLDESACISFLFHTSLCFFYLQTWSCQYAS